MTVTRLVLSAAAAFVCVAAAPTAARAQSTIAGVVTDASGAALHGVTVEVASDAVTEKSRRVTAAGAGAGAMSAFAYALTRAVGRVVTDHTGL
jgi:hypothetical protein